MTAERTYKRRMLNLSVNRGLQFHMIGRLTLILFVCLLLSSAVYYYFSNQEVTSSFRLFHIKAQNFLDFLLPVVLASFFISLIIGAIASLFFPKPIAGGLYRIEREISNIIDTGDLTVHISLRRGDRVKSVAQQVNRLVENYRRTLSEVDGALAKAREVSSSEAETPPEERLEKIQALHEQIGKTISKMKLS